MSAITLAQNADGSAVQYTPDNQPYPPVRKWATELDPFPRRNSNGDTEQCFWDEDGFLGEVKISTAIMPGMYDVIDFELWTDKAGRIRSIPRNNNARMDVKRVRNGHERIIHLCDAYGWHRSTLEEVKAYRALSAANRAKDAKDIEARGPSHGAKAIAQALQENAAANTAGVVKAVFEELRSSGLLGPAAQAPAAPAAPAPAKKPQQGGG